MNKIWLIIRREYVTRVRKRTFIVTTILVPLLSVALIAGMVALAMNSTSTKHIAVVDDSGMFKDKLKNEDHIIYTFTQQDVNTLKTNAEYDGVLHIPKFNLNDQVNFSMFGKEQLGLDAKTNIEKQLNDIAVSERMAQSGMNIKTLDSLRASNISVVSYDDKGNSKSAEKAYVLGYGCGFLLYIFMLLYGMSVMRSVMEEKTNRIAEIIVSSVKPRQLMMGKIIGVALVGLTQFLIWIALTATLSTIGINMFAGNIMADPELVNQAAQQAAVPHSTSEIFNFLLGDTNWVQVVCCFIFYFLGGYFLYAALFAAVGSLVNEDPQDAQQLTLPITLPIIFSFVAMTIALKEPNGGLAVFFSIFPLTSPIVMMARIPFGVPGWQLAASFACLILGFIFTTWLAAKIYRTGILLYGKKITLREVGKWLVRK